MDMSVKLRLLYVGPTAGGKPFIWIDGRVLADQEQMPAGLIASAMGDATGHRHDRRVSHGLTTWTRGTNYLLVETPIAGRHDDRGRPLVCTMLFEGLPADHQVALPVDVVLSLLAEHGVAVDPQSIRRALRDRNTAPGSRRWAQETPGMGRVVAAGAMLGAIGGGIALKVWQAVRNPEGKGR